MRSNDWSRNRVARNKRWRVGSTRLRSNRRRIGGARGEGDETTRQDPEEMAGGAAPLRHHAGPRRPRGPVSSRAGSASIRALLILPSHRRRRASRTSRHLRRRPRGHRNLARARHASRREATARGRGGQPNGVGRRMLCGRLVQVERSAARQVDGFVGGSSCGCIGVGRVAAAALQGPRTRNREAEALDCVGLGGSTHSSGRVPVVEGHRSRLQGEPITCNVMSSLVAGGGGTWTP